MLLPAESEKVMLPLFLSARKSGLEVPTVKREDDEGEVVPMAKTPAKVEVAVVEVAVKYCATASPTTESLA